MAKRSHGTRDHSVDSSAVETKKMKLEKPEKPLDISDYIFVEWKHDSQWPGFLRCAILPIRGDRGGDLTKYFVQRRNKTETTPEGDIIVVKVWQELEAPETLKYRETAVCPHYEGTNEKPDYNPYFPSHNRTWKNNEGFDQREKDPASYDISDPLTPTNMMATLKATNQRTANNVLQRWLLDLRLALIAFKDNLTGPGGPESHFSPPLLPSHDQIPPDLKPESKAKKGKGPVAGGAQEDSPLPDPPTAPLPTLAVQQATGSKRHGAAQKGSAGLQPSLEDDKHVVGAKSGGWTIRFKTDLTSRFDAYHYEQISLAFQKVLKLPEPIPVKVLREAREAAIAFNGVAAVMTTKPMQKYLRSINHLLHINPYTTDDPVMVTISNWKLLNPRWNDKWFENGW